MVLVKGNIVVDKTALGLEETLCFIVDKSYCSFFRGIPFAVISQEGSLRVSSHFGPFSRKIATNLKNSMRAVLRKRIELMVGEEATSIFAKSITDQRDITSVEINIILLKLGNCVV
jgi:hypothetical protein